MGYLGGQAVLVVDIWKKLQSESNLANARIVRLTHVKNLDSALAHEYLQFILVTKNGRERVLVERTDPDQFVFNGQWKMPGGFFGRGIGWPDPFNLAKNDLPLPLYTLQWEERKGPTFYQFAQICQAVHDKAPEYSLVAGRHCYWFALGVYTATKLAYGGVEETWPFANMRGSPTFLLPWGSTDSNKLKLFAATFQKTRAKTMDYLDDSGPDVIEEALKAVDLISPALEGEEIQGKLKEEMLAYQESKPTSIIDGLDIATTPREQPFRDVTLEETYDLSNFERGNHALKEAMKKDPEAKDNIAIYREVRNARANEGLDKSKTILHVSANDEFGYSKIVEDAEGMDMAMEAFLGAILKEIGVAQK
ncbi:hypothetical protein CPB83DRAFT_903340 [Crepidotus variabilis]|uniref:Uncharacterized protein n=1 Tax=Crepidotus variabilis TaxID=179855 RepID=A0A9P6EQ29_9AGAR|nr:hypothetical protein CPB83DRAFT_903340 [Crepidotus variabilis]